jgi:SAM-dependent methyltransferase
MELLRQYQDNNLFSVKTYDCFAHVYEQWFMDISPYKAKIDDFCQYLPSSKSKILDLGCGPGNYSKYLFDIKGFRNVHGIDLSEQMIMRASKNVPLGQFTLGDIRKLSVPNSFYYGALASFCVPYLSYHETDQLISDIYKALKPSGTFYLSCMEGVRCGFEPTGFSGEMAVFVYYYTEDFLVGSLEERGFHVLSVDRQPYLDVDGGMQTDLIIIARKS